MKANTRAETNAIAKMARHAIAKSSLDISQLNITCSPGGQVDLSGSVKPPRDYSGEMNVRKEFESLMNMIRSLRGVKEVYGDRVQMPGL